MDQKSVKILIAEDNLVNQKVLRIILDRHSLEYEIAEDGVTVVEKFSAGDYDLVLMDCQMPRMDGLTASHQLRQLETSQNRKRTPIVAMTANAMAGDRERCLSAGMDDFLAKPFKTTELIEVVRRWSSR